MVVVADSTPLHYLILIDQIELLPRLFDLVLIPESVVAELQHAKAPEVVRRWIAEPPAWLHVHALRAVPDDDLQYLDPGEREAIALAEELLDDGKARREAARRGLSFIGTLGVLREAARREHVALKDVLDQLSQTTFYVDPDLIESLMNEEKARRDDR